jgi:hypothetical protein
MRKYALALASATALLVGASAANAKLVTFESSPSYFLAAKTFADGTFSWNLSGDLPDGFYDFEYPTNPYTAINGFGQNGEFIQFDHAVVLNSLAIGKCGFCYDSHPTTFTVNLYNSGSVLIDSRTVLVSSLKGSSTQETLRFNESGVSKVEFTFAGTDGSQGYADGRKTAWYTVSDVAYSLGVPEPALWALMVGGFGLAGGLLRRRRVAAA